VPWSRAPFCIQLAPAPPSRIHSGSTIKTSSAARICPREFCIEFYSLDTGKVVYASMPKKTCSCPLNQKILTEVHSSRSLAPIIVFTPRLPHRAQSTSTAHSTADLILVASGGSQSSIASSPTALSPSSIMTTPTTAPALPVIPGGHQTTRQGCLRKKGFARSKPCLRRRHSASRCGSRRWDHVVNVPPSLSTDKRHRSRRQTWRQAGDPSTHRFPPTGSIEFVNKLTTSEPGSQIRLVTPIL